MKYHAENQLRCSTSYHHQSSHEEGLTPQYAIVYISQGVVWYSDKTKKNVRLEQWDAFQRFPEVEHKIVFEGGTKIHSAAVPSNVYESFKCFNLKTLESPILKPGYSKSLLKRHSDLTEELLVSAPYQKIKLMTKIQNWMVDLHLLAQEYQWESAEEKWVSQAYSLLSHPDNFTKRLEDISSELGISYPTFRKRFKEITAIAPGDFRIIARLERSKELLQNGYAVSEIAFKLGFTDIYAFSAQFKKHVGRSPKSWLLEAKELS